ncbi:MAG: hypothetical protein CMJ48_00480 [Planctomycetaceae bacterium]|nr:hypothetical protein [Planctomycetaceae bacterium]
MYASNRQDFAVPQAKRRSAALARGKFTTKQNATQGKAQLKMDVDAALVSRSPGFVFGSTKRVLPSRKDRER